MNAFSLWVTLLAAATMTTRTVQAQQKFIAGAVNERAVGCPNDKQLTAYKNVIDANVDQQTELRRIANGEAPRTPYIFPFCGRFKFNMSAAPLRVLLPNITFVCGYNGTNDELCVFDEGKEQVIISSDYSATVTFQGMTFSGFSGISTKAYGSPHGRVIYNDAAWTKFVDKAVGVHQQSSTGGTAMSVEVNKAKFEGGDGGDMLVNDRGTLTFDDLLVHRAPYQGAVGVRADSIIATLNGGTSTLSKVNVTASYITKITYTRSGSTQTVSNVVIDEMLAFGTAFLVEGTGSTLTASTINCTNNKIRSAFKSKYSRNFNLVIAMNNSVATVNDVEFGDNDGVDRIFGASSGAQMYVTGANIYNSGGTSPPDLLSNVAMAEDGGSMNVLRLNVTNVSNFSAIYFATCGSTIQVLQSCVWSGSNLQTPAFISFGSQFTTKSNFIAAGGVGSTECRNMNGNVIYKEGSINSQCFSNTVTGSCNQGTCISGFAESTTTCSIGNNLGLSLATKPGTSGNPSSPSCPSSPPTPVPTLPPVATAAPVGPTKPLIPCGNPGAPASCTSGGPGSPSSTSGGGGSGGGGSNPPGQSPSTVFTAPSGSGSGSAALSSNVVGALQVLGKIGCTLLVVTLMPDNLFY